ncbi:ER membrane protein complex subunit 4 [Staphylotrichum tortipilum]|uniref:ER membrane protein complex subunit 4 n=1 Tax=Staphylotrichum tortipilum TaxID=2831512 RepID=A0AAN6RWG5_9PEZI|nr:ER membrane protein complex subunit 4 [Staphylotrichum longicolle]
MATVLTTSQELPAWAAQLKNPPAHKSKNAGIPDPPGYPSSQSQKDAKDSKSAAAQRTAPTPDEMDTLKVKKAWEVALGPIKGLPMTAIMMYMSGNSLQIFSIMMVFMAFKNPIMGILGTNQAFERFETNTNRAKIIQVKLAYVLMQFVALALGIWKVNGMGLLPTTRSDWLAWEAQREAVEHAVPAL